MRDPKCARVMLQAAERDLLTLRYMNSRVPDESFGFHVQQAAEKALKALMALLGRKYPLTHNHYDLFALLDEEGVATGFYRPLSSFTPYAVEFRYEGVGPGHEPLTAQPRSPSLERWSGRSRTALGRLSSFPSA